MIKIFTSILFLFVFLVFGNIAFSQHLPSLVETSLPEDLKSCDLKKIGSVSYYYFEVKNDTVPAKKHKREDYIFKDGNLLILKQFDPITGDVRIIKEYDRLGRIISELHSVKNAFQPEVKYSYDEPNRTTIVTILNDDSTIIQKRINVYNNINKIDRVNVFNSSNVLTCYYTFQYNKNRDLLRSCFYNTTNGAGQTFDSSITGGKPRVTLWPNDSTIFKFKYGKHKRVKQKAEYWHSELKKKTEYIINGDTSIVVELTYGNYNDKPIRKSTTKIFDTQRIVYIEFLNDDQSVSSWFRSKYLNEDLTESESNEGNGGKNIYWYKYDYDDFGNWIKKQRYLNDKLIFVTVRAISYNPM